MSRVQQLEVFGAPLPSRRDDRWPGSWGDTGGIPGPPPIPEPPPIVVATAPMAEPAAESAASEPPDGHDDAVAAERPAPGAAAAGAGFGAAPAADLAPFPAPLPLTRHDRWPGVLDPDAREGEDALERPPALPSLPGPARRRRPWTFISFVVLVLLPTMLVGIYYFVFADNEYYSEFRFSVTQGVPVLPGTSSGAMQTAATGQSGAASGVLAALSGGAATAAAPQNFLVTDYLTSEQAVRDLQRQIDLRKLFSSDDINWWQRVDAGATIEQLTAYMQKFISAEYDQVTGLAVVGVKAFSPRVAELVASTLSRQAEQLINEINTRANKDAVAFADREVKDARQHMRDVNVEMLEFRTKQQVIDPGSGPVATNVQLVQSLQSSLISLQTQLSSLEVQNPKLASGPTARGLRAQIAATKKELDSVEQRVAKDREGSKALAQLVSKYQELTFDQQYAQNMLVQTMQALDMARANAATQHLYIQPYVHPSLPQSAAYPSRGLNTLLGGLILFAIWLAGVLVVKAIQDHAV